MLVTSSLPRLDPAAEPPALVGEGASATLPLARWPATAGFVAAALATLPLFGWGAGWFPLAGYVTGWQVVAVPVSIALALAGVALAIGYAVRAGEGARRASAAIGGGVGAIGLVELVRGPTVFRQADGPQVVESWYETPAALLGYGASLPEASALLFLGVALLLLLPRHPIARRAAYLSAVGAIVLALLASGPPLRPETTLERTLASGRDLVMPPTVALLVLLLGSGILLVGNGDDRLWGIPVRASALALTRLLLPGVLLIPPTLVWLVELARRRQVVAAGEADTLLAVALVAGMAMLVASAAVRAHVVADAERIREERRVRRQARRESEQAVVQAEHTARIAADRFRAQLLGILEVAPTAFLALDRAGRLVYANAAASALLGRSVDRAVGQPLAALWPELGAQVSTMLSRSVGGAPMELVMEDPHSGRALELRGHLGEEGIALFVRER